MLIGQYESKLTSKNQVSFPKKFRSYLGNKLIITKGIDSNLIVVSQKQYKTLLEGTEGLPFLDLDARELQRFILGNASVVELDAKGRFVLPSFLREFAHLQEDVIFAGVERFVEVWDKEEWDAHQIEISKRVITISQRLTEKNAK